MPTPQTKNDSLSSPSGHLRYFHWLCLLALLISPGLATGRFAGPGLALWFAGWWALASAVTYALYAWDKRSAGRGGERTPENLLHFWELIGGWPGAYLAQHSLRHKTAKRSYQVAFWLIVALHQYVALDYQLGWRLFFEGKRIAFS